jgi:hypothetical protein
LGVLEVKIIGTPCNKKGLDTHSITQASIAVQKQIAGIVTITVDDKINCTGQNLINC